MNKRERLRKAAEDRARANRRHVDDPDYNKPVEVKAEPGAAKFTDVFQPATEKQLSREEAEEFRRQKALKDKPDDEDPQEDEEPEEEEEYDDEDEDAEEEEEEEEEDESYKHKETGERPRSKLSKRQQELIHAGVNQSQGRGVRDRVRARKPDRPREARPEEAMESGKDFFQERAGEVFAYLAGFVHYAIPMDDGTTLQVYRVKPPKYDFEEFKDMLARYQSGIDEKGRVFKNAMVARQAEIIMEDRKFAMYLRERGTDRPIHREDILHAEDSTVPDAIVETCLAISLSRWVEGKKLETITNQAL